MCLVIGKNIEDSLQFMRKAAQLPWVHQPRTRFFSKHSTLITEPVAAIRHLWVQK